MIIAINNVSCSQILYHVQGGDRYENSKIDRAYALNTLVCNSIIFLKRYKVSKLSISKRWSFGTVRSNQKKSTKIFNVIIPTVKRVNDFIPLL